MTRTQAAVLAMITFALLASPAGADVYISPLGSDTTGNGSVSSPYATLQKGVDALKIVGPGNTLYLRGGVYSVFPTDGSWRGVRFYRLNDATSWSNAYHIRSYPGEWAIIDGSNYPSEEMFYALYGYPAGQRHGFIEISYLEFRNIRGRTHSAAIDTSGGPFWFHHLYIHDVTCGTASNNPAGLRLENGTGDTLIEYCAFKGNGALGSTDINSAQLAIFSDYLYASWGSVTLNGGPNGYATARHNNEVRYCLFDGGAGSNKSTVGFTDKASQRLASSPYLGQPVDQNAWSGEGERIHHNVFLNHTLLGMSIKTDFTQVYNNVVVQPTTQFGEGIRIGPTSDGALRGPWRVVVYNNTIIGGGQGALAFWDKPTGATRLYSEEWAYNNIFVAPADYDSTQDLTFNKYYSTAPEWDSASLARASANYFYRPLNETVARVLTTDYTLTQLNAALRGINYSNPAISGDPLFKATSGNDSLKTRGAHVLAGAVTVANGGIGGLHPYLPGVTFPTYVGATDPSNDAWVDVVMALSNTAFLNAGPTGPAPGGPARPTGVSVK